MEPPRDSMRRALIVGAGSGGRVIAAELRMSPEFQFFTEMAECQIDDVCERIEANISAGIGV